MWFDGLRLRTLTGIGHDIPTDSVKCVHEHTYVYIYIHIYIYVYVYEPPHPESGTANAEREALHGNKMSPCSIRNRTFKILGSLQETGHAFVEMSLLHRAHSVDEYDTHQGADVLVLSHQSGLFSVKSCPSDKERPSDARSLRD